MHDDSGARSLFVDAIEIPAWLEADRSTPYEQRLHRDRGIGQTVAAAAPLERVREWRRRIVDASAAPALALALRLERARRIVALLMGFVGALVGAATASAVFHYDGTWPVNVVTALAVLVALQLALIVLTLVLTAPRIPGMRALQDLISAVNPGALAAALYRRIARVDDGAAGVLVWSEARGPAAARFARWQMLTWSQTAAIAFNLAALATAIALIAFTDLAFGWSTTLRVDSDDVQRLTDLLSAPWAAIWPEAAPSAAMIENSRFYRLAAAPPREVAAQSLTGWWPFLLAAVVTYGLIPRCLLRWWSGARLRAAAASLLLDDPQVRALLDRMAAAEVRLGADEAESAPAPWNSRAAAPPRENAAATAIVWSGALPHESVSQWSVARLGREVSAIMDAGGGELAADAEVIRRAARGAPQAVLVIVRGWEAPLLDLKDFLLALRAAVGPQCSLIVAPVSPDAAPASAAQQATWSRWLARLADPALYLEGGA